MEVINITHCDICGTDYSPRYCHSHCPHERKVKPYVPTGFGQTVDRRADAEKKQ